MMLVEIILGKKTGDAALAVALDYVRAIRKTPIVVNDSRGFYANRCVVDLHPEGHLMLLEGIPAAMIENVARMAGMPVGPLSLNDEVALDLGLKIVRAAEADLGAERDRSARRRSCWRRWSRSAAASAARTARASTIIRKASPKRLWPGLAELLPKTLTLDHRRDRRRGTEAAPPGDAGARDRALLRGEGRHRRARGRCRLDPRLRLCAVIPAARCPTST